MTGLRDTDRSPRSTRLLLWWLDTLGHALHLTWVRGFWRLCDAYDLSLGTPDTPENFPRRWGR